MKTNHTMTGAEIDAVMTNPKLLNRVLYDFRHLGGIDEETRRLVRQAVGTPRMPKEEQQPEDDALWAHRDEGVVAYLIACGVELRMVADLDTDRPLYVSDVPAHDPGHLLERMVTEYQMHMLHSYRHRRPQLVHARAMACADQQLERLVAMGRAAGQDTIDVPEGAVWIWLADDEERAMIDSTTSR